MNDIEMILALVGMFFMIMFMGFLEDRHKEKYKDYYYVKEYRTPERPIKRYCGKGTRKIEQPPFPKRKNKT